MKFSKIKPDFEIGLEWLNDEGKKCVSIAPPPHAKTGKRIVELIEASYIGCVAGMHYYAKLFVPVPWWVQENDDGRHCGYGGKAKPNMNGFSLDAERILTVQEYDANRRSIGKSGDSTYRFNNPKSARKAAIQLFKKTFAKGWVLMPEYGGESDLEIIAET